MKRLYSYVKTTSAIALVVMLLLSMMSGVLTLSASADDVNLPVVVNHPTLTYHTTPKGDYCRYSAFNVVMDDSACDDAHKLDAITSIDYYMEYRYSYSSSGTGSSRGTYYDLENYNVPAENQYSSRGYIYLQDFNMLIFQNPFVETNFDNSYSGIIQNFKLRLHFADGSYTEVSVQPKEVFEYTMTGYQDSSSYFLNTANTEIITLPDSMSFDANAFLKLENAIVAAENINTTTKRLYVNSESKKDIVLPMENMSSYVSLVQTRVGDNIVYDTENSVDFLDNAIGPVPEDTQNTGRALQLPDGTVVSEEDLSPVVDYLFSKGYYYLTDANQENVISLLKFYYESYGRLGSSIPTYYVPYGRYASSLIDMDLLEKGYCLSDYHAPLPGTQVDQQTVENLVKNAAADEYGGITQFLPSFRISFDTTTGDPSDEELNSQSFEFLTSLKDYLENGASDTFKNFVVYNSNNPTIGVVD